MTRAIFLAILVGAILTLTSCGVDNQGPDSTAQPENTEPTIDDESSDEVELIGDGEAITAEQIGGFSSRPILPTEMRPPVFHVAFDESELETGWEMYQLDGEFPEADWESDAILFMGLSESGSCPWSFIGLSVDADELYGHLVYDVDHPDDQPVDCTADDNPRTFVVRVDRDSLLPDEMIVRLVHDQFDYFPLRTDQRDMPLNSIDPTRHAYPFEVWRSDDPNGSDEHERVVEWAEVIALDETSLSLRLGFQSAEMVPDLDDSEQFSVIEPGAEYVSTRLGMTVRDASLGFPPPDMPDIYTAPYRQVAVAGRDYHPMMARAIVTLHPRADDVDQRSDVEFWVSLDPDPDEMNWDFRVVDDGATLELEIKRINDER